VKRFRAFQRLSPWRSRINVEATSGERNGGARRPTERRHRRPRPHPYGGGVRPARLVAALAVLVVAGCSDGGSDDVPVDDAAAVGCLVGPSRVGDALGYEVEVVERTRTFCRFEPVDSVEHPGAQVMVTRRDLADGEPGETGYDAALADVEAEVGPVDPLPQDAVDGADRGYVAALGRVVQVGAAVDDRLVQVTVADGALDAAGARAVAEDLAEDAIG
jgi:hypothetical protein